MKIVAIDPGVTPTLCLRYGDVTAFFEETSVKVKRNKTMKSEPAAVLIAQKLREWQPDLVVIENVQPRPVRDGRAQGMGSTAAFMAAKGILIGICAGLELPTEMVSPLRWQRDMKLRKGGEENVRMKALEIFPKLGEQLKRKKDHNRAAALLMAVWGERFAAPNHPLL